MPPKHRSGIKLKKGERSQLTTKYITRTRALKKLQLTLSQFRYLCILKGIFPSLPPKYKTKPSKKIYYNVKDISYILHEPLVQKLRDMKIFTRRINRLISRKEINLAKDLETRKPEFNIDHIIKERYPTFMDAVKDLDDGLSLVYLQTCIPRGISGLADDHAEMTARVTQEWENWVVRSKSLRKVFVSIKGYYFQAQIKGQNVTWLVPHTIAHQTPSTIDYSIINSFLFLYETLMRFVNYKLYKDEGLSYPPVDCITSDTDVHAIFPKKQAKRQNNSASVKTLSVSSEAMLKDAEESLLNEVVEDEDLDLEKFAALDKDSLPILSKITNAGDVFKGCVFLIGRETPYEQISLVIRAGGGYALPEVILPEKYHTSPQITHQIVDRPSINGKFIVSRKYIQPQWVFDSFNEKLQLPIPPYAPGTKLPPHLSPFINDAEEGYIPEQRNQLRLWAGLQPILLDANTQNPDENEEDGQSDEEELFTEDTHLVTEGLGDDNDNDSEEHEVEIIGDSDSGSEHEDDDDDDDESEEEEEKIQKPAHPTTFDSRDNEREFAKLMMSATKRRKLNAYENADRVKQQKNNALLAKRRKIQAAKDKN